MTFHSFGEPSATLTSSPPGFSCSGTRCTQTASYEVGSNIVLTANGLPAGALSRWSNDCTGTSCTIALSAPTTVTLTSTANNVVFLTSNTHDGNFGNIGAADSFCNQAAATAGLPGTFVAFLGTSADPTGYTRLSGRGWVRPDGLAFADTPSSLQNRMMWYPAALTELGARPPPSPVMTGTIINASNVLQNCKNWTTNTTTELCDCGLSASAGLLWNQGESDACSQAHSFLCFQVDFSQPLALNATNGLHTGRRAFVSKMQFSGAFGGPTAGDAQCQTEAASAGLTNASKFKALLATTSASAASRFDMTGQPWVRPDGVLLATTTANLMTGHLLAPIALHADGSPASSGSDWATYAWVGSSAGFSAVGTASETCNNWSSASASSTGWNGDPEYGDMTTWNAYPCDAVANSLFCLEN